MTDLPRFTKDPDEDLDYMINWLNSDLPLGRRPYLSEEEVIVTSQWIVPAGLTSHDASATDTTTTIWLSGGSVRSSYTVTNRITTNMGRTVDRSFIVLVKSR
jgi:hypothetical protein